MSYRALVKHFSAADVLPIRIDDVVAWVREHTDHKHIGLHAVSRNKRAFRGAFRRRAISTSLQPYIHDESSVEIHTDILYGEDLPSDWKRLVICKELLHVFDAEGAWVNTVETLRQLIPAVITPELLRAPFEPAIDDHLGAYKALAVLLPSAAREALGEAVKNGDRAISEVASFVQIPDFYVDIWLRWGAELEPTLCEWYD